MNKKQTLADMVAALEWAKKEAKRLQRVSEKNRAKARAADNRVCRLCGFDICPEVHHIVPSSKGGSDKLSNLVTLCPNHHAMADRGLISVEVLQRSVAKRTHAGRMAAVNELVQDIWSAHADIGGKDGRPEDLRAFLKTELPSRAVSIYGPLNADGRKRLDILLGETFDRVFYPRRAVRYRSESQ